MFGYIFEIIGILILQPIITLVLQLITFELIPKKICSIIATIICGILILLIILDFIIKFIEGVFRFFGKDIDISWSIDLSLKEIKEKVKQQKKEKYRLVNQSVIEKELNEIKKEYNLITDNTLIERFEPPNNTTYMNNDEKYPYVMEQEQRVKRLFTENKDLFKITDNGIFLKEQFHSNEFGYYYNDEDIKFLNKVYPIAPQDIEKIIKRRYDCFNSIKECLNKATFEAISTKKGKDGENNVANQLNLFKDNFIILNNIRVELEGQSSESDFIVICDKGVFAIEVKNHGNINSMIEISSDGRWTMTNNGKKEVKDNVSAQNNRHCAINQTILNKELKNRGINTDYIKCKSIITIANDKVALRNNSMNIVLRASEIITYIENLNTDTKLDRRLQEEIANVFKERNLSPKRYPVVDLANNLSCSIQELIRLNNILTGYSKLRSAYSKYVE